MYIYMMCVYIYIYIYMCMQRITTHMLQMHVLHMQGPGLVNGLGRLGPRPRQKQCSKSCRNQVSSDDG